MSTPDTGSLEPGLDEVPVRRYERRSLRWRPLLVEALFVMLGVALALAADQWREAANQRRRADTALASIREELETNRLAVEQSLSYHSETFETLHALRQQAAAARQGGGAAPRPDGRTFSRGFVNPAQLLFTAWEAAHATDLLGHMEYADVLALARIYEQQRAYQGQSLQIGELIYGKLFDEGFEGMLLNYANLNSVISALAYRECQLLVGYAEASAALDDRAGADPVLPEFCRRRLGAGGGRR